MRRLRGVVLPAAARVLLAVIAMQVCACGALAEALRPIAVQPEVDRLDITPLGDAYEGRGDSLQVETASGADGVSGRMTVRASVPGTSPNWLVFALTNKTDKPLERLVVSDRYIVIGSGAIWPDLDSARIQSIIPSVGFVPERIKSDKADVFRLTLEPGQTITYVAELNGDRLARVFLWRPIDYEIKSRERLLANGMMLGATFLLAVFLTAIFAGNHKIIFPTAALLSWSAFMYLCVDFGLFHRIFNLRPEDNAVYRAATEASVAASLLIFMTTFLRLGLWHGLMRMLIGVWVVAQLTLVAVAVIDPRLASTFARLSFAVIGGIGSMLILYLSMRGQDRAQSLIPPWLLLLVWIFAAGLTVSGRLSGDMIVTGLSGGLVIILLVIGFVVTQYAFRSSDAVYAGQPSELQARSLAVAVSGSSLWEWNIRRDEIRVGPEVEMALALMPGELSCKLEDFLNHLHPTDKERLRVMLMSVQERAGVRMRSDFRLRHSDNSWRWYELEAASVPNADGRTLRCVGLMRDVSDSKRAHERLLHDAVHCSLTGLPNRELFLDRLRGAVARAKAEGAIKPAVIFIDLDKFKSVNSSFGLVRGDSLLLTVARRLQRHLGPQDTVARVGGDQFAMLFTGEEETRNLPALAERIRRSLRAPIPLANQEIVLTGSIGIALFDGTQSEDDALLREAELAMYRAKRSGSDRIEMFEAQMRRERDDRVQIESDLRRALEKNQIKVLYQPIVYLPTKELAGFEALVRWEHPRLGLLNPVSFVPVAEESDLIIKVGSHVLLRAAKDAARWQSELPRIERPLFVSVNISTRQLFKPEAVQEIRHVLGRNIVPAGTLRLEVTESLVMENPEQAADILKMLAGSGAHLALDDFGTGYSSLAYLQRFPFDTIKVARELVRTSSTSSGSAIMRSIVALAHELSKTVVAEGVESADEATFLRSIGCEFAQGYHFGEPIPERDVTQLLKMVRRSERKMQPRGFFRPKLKSAKADKPSEGGVTDGRLDDKAAGIAAAASPARAALASVADRLQAVPGKVVVRPRQKPARAPVRPMTPAANLPTMGSEVAGLGTAVSGSGLSPAAFAPPAGMPPLPRDGDGASATSAGQSLRELQEVQALKGMPAMPPGMVRPQERAPSSPSNVVGLPGRVAGNGSAEHPHGIGGRLGAPVGASGDGAAGVNPLVEALAAIGPAPFGAPPAAKAAPAGSVGSGDPARADKTVVNPIPLQVRPPDFSTLPPGIAASLARLAGVEPPPPPQQPGASGHGSSAGDGKLASGKSGSS